VPDFIREIRRLFTAKEICDYLDLLENTKYLASPDPGLEMDELDELDDPDEDEPWLENPVMGAEELLRFPASDNSFRRRNRHCVSYYKSKKLLLLPDACLPKTHEYPRLQQSSTHLELLVKVFATN
jgi:hypothetical protein